MANDLLDELTAWDPREWITTVKRWHRGPFGALTLVHLNVIAELEVRGAMSMGHLADALGVSVASTTGIVGRMEKRGLVERQRGGDDRRVVTVCPTARGAEVFRVMEARRRAHLAQLLESLTEEEMTGFAVGLRALRRARTDGAAGLPPPLAEGVDDTLAAAPDATGSEP